MRVVYTDEFVLRRCEQLCSIIAAFNYVSIVSQFHTERSAGFKSVYFVMPVDITDQGTEVIVRSEGIQGVEVQVLKSYGVGIDCHSRFIAICVHVRNNQRIFKYTSEADTDWDSLVKAKEWVIDTIRMHSNPVPDLRQPLHYVIEATSTYHMPILRAWGWYPFRHQPNACRCYKEENR